MKNIYLKRSFIGMMSPIGVIGLLLLGYTLYCHAFTELPEHVEAHLNIPWLLTIYIFSTVILFLAIIGGFGVWKGKKWALIVFAVGGILICLILLFTAVYVLIGLLEVEKYSRINYLERLPLEKANEYDLNDLIYKQGKFQCCGLVSYKDWKNLLPKTCLCDEKSTNPCVNVRNAHVATSQEGRYWYRGTLEGQTVRIYSKPCLSIMVADGLEFLKMQVVVLSGFMMWWLLSVVLCITILCQMNKKMETPKVVFSPEANAGKYCHLTEAPDSNPET